MEHGDLVEYYRGKLLERYETAAHTKGGRDMLPNTMTTNNAPADPEKIKGDVERLRRTGKEMLIREIRSELEQLTEQEQRQLLAWMREEFGREQKEKLGLRV